MLEFLLLNVRWVFGLCVVGVCLLSMSICLYSWVGSGLPFVWRYVRLLLIFMQVYISYGVYFKTCAHIYMCVGAHTEDIFICIIYYVYAYIDIHFL